MIKTCLSKEVFKSLEEKQPVVLLDVREPVEFAHCHIDGAILNPLSELDKLQLDKAAKIVVVCRSGKRARKGAEQLVQRGYEDVSVLDGGMQSWQTDHLPVEENNGIWSLERQVRFAAGLLVFSGTLLGCFVSRNWLILPGFVGAGLMFAGATDFCGMALLLAKAPWNRSNQLMCR